jgi:uncharacterized protein CbrC (UPF0167 family)
VRLSAAFCHCCGQSRGFIYVGPVYGEVEILGYFCPWCIADGSAHHKFAVEFTDLAGVGGYGTWGTITRQVQEEVAYRTPGFSGWQQEQWWTHCSDAAAFLGFAGYKEVECYGSQLVELLRLNSGLTSEDDWQTYYHAMDKKRSPTAYLFRCLHCNKVGGYSDNT